MQRQGERKMRKRMENEEEDRDGEKGKVMARIPAEEMKEKGTSQEKHK